MNDKGSVSRMKKIILLCAGGMSTSVLVNNMKKEAAAQQFNCEIDAYAVDAAKKVGAEADCVLIGPQIAYKLEEVKKVVPCPVADIDMAIYGMMDGKKALEMAQKLMGVL